MRQTILLPRRTFLRRSAAALALSGVGAPFIIRSRAALAATSDTALPGLPYGIMSGDVGTDRAVIWSRSDRPARVIVEYATSDSFANAQRVMGPAALEDTDFTARVNLGDLPANEHISVTGGKKSDPIKQQ
jgi:alkaline phosphatase D